MKTPAVLAVPTLLAALASTPAEVPPPPRTADDNLVDLRGFYAKTAKSAGSFRPGIAPDYKGMSDSASSDLAPVAYALVVHKTFGWKLPDEMKTTEFLLARQQKDGAFVNVAGTVDPKSAVGRAYDTTMGLRPSTPSGRSRGTTRCRCSRSC